MTTTLISTMYYVQRHVNKYQIQTVHSPAYTNTATSAFFVVKLVT